jgi:hypothetical protein
MLNRTLIVIASSLTAAVAAPSNADVLANWTFESSIPVTAGPHMAEGGLNAASSFASGLHASGSTVYSNPAGNGSAESFSSNFWAVGDYYQVSSSSTGYENITLSWDQTGSNTGPIDFMLQYSTNGIDFFDIGAYQMATIGAPPVAVSWSSASTAVGTSYFVDLSSILALNDAASILFRFTNNSTASINGGTVATGGTNRIDNVVINGDAIPAPGALALLGLAGMMGRSRRRR